MVLAPVPPQLKHPPHPARSGDAQQSMPCLNTPLRSKRFDAHGGDQESSFRGRGCPPRSYGASAHEKSDRPGRPLSFPPPPPTVSPTAPPTVARAPPAVPAPPCVARGSDLEAEQVGDVGHVRDGPPADALHRVHTHGADRRQRERAAGPRPGRRVPEVEEDGRARHHVRSRLHREVVDERKRLPCAPRRRVIAGAAGALRTTPRTGLRMKLHGFMGAHRQSPAPCRR